MIPRLIRRLYFMQKIPPNDTCELPEPGRRDGRVRGRLELDALCAKPPYASSTCAAFWAACSASIRRCYIEDMFEGWR